MKRWKKALAAGLAALVLVTGGLFAWKGSVWFSPADPPAVYEFPAPDPLVFDPPNTQLPPIQGYTAEPMDFALDNATGLEFVKHILVVYFGREATEAQRQAVIAAAGGEIAGKAERIGKWELRVQGESLAALEELCNALEAMPGVIAATPDYVITFHQQAETDDPWKGSPTRYWWAEAIRLPEAWEYNRKITQTVTVGQMDTGINTGHEELAGFSEMITNINVTDYLNAEGASLENPPKNVYSYNSVPTEHATSVASIMAGKANNQKGLAGVLHNAKVYGFDYEYAMPQKPLEVRTTLHTVYDGVAALAEAGAPNAGDSIAINLSVGHLHSAITGIRDPEEQLLHSRSSAAFLAQMIRYGYRRVVVVQSAGNFRADAVYNGMFASVKASNCGLEADLAKMVCDRIVIVGGMELTGSGYQQFSNSAIGPQVSLYAPAVSIYAAGLSNNGYIYGTGNSYSTPQVTAAAAWMLAANPALDGGQVGALLKLEAVSPKNVKDFGNNNYHPMLDVRRALDAAYPERVLEAEEGASFTIAQEEGLVLLAEATVPEALDDYVAAWGGSYSRDTAQDGVFLGTGQQAAVISPLGEAKTYTLLVKGDLSGDGRVDAADAQLLQQKLASAAFDLGLSEAVVQAAADYNGDGAVNAADAQAMFDRGME